MNKKNNNYFAAAFKLNQQKIPFVTVTVQKSCGSTPQKTGAKMIVTMEGLYYGTIGGGAIENQAIKNSLSLLETQDSHQLIDFDLNKDLGMSCGGRVTLSFEKTAEPNWNIVIFGAGHVSLSLINILKDLNCNLTCYDYREEWLEKIPEEAHVKKMEVEKFKIDGKQLQANSFIVIMTTGHEFDQVILEQLLAAKIDFPYIGVIGSKAKAKTLKGNLVEKFTAAAVEKITSPIGLPLGNNTPEEIAISIAAQLLQIRDK